MITDNGKLVQFKKSFYLCFMEKLSREIKFEEVLDQVVNNFKEIKYNNGDISDLGNEVGYAIGTVLPNMTEEEIKDFIFGIKHGISLTNGTH